MDSGRVIAELTALYDAAVERLRGDIAEYVRSGTPPSPERRTDGSYCYPELRVRYAGGPPASDRMRSFGRLHEAGTYATTITRPALYASYLAEQLDLLIEDFDVVVETGRSRQEIPFPYVLEGYDGATLAGITPNELARHFPTTELKLSPLTPKDLHDLDFVAQYADLVGFSFVQRPADVALLQDQLAARR